MKTKKIILLTVSLLFFTGFSYAQYGMGKLKDITEMKKRKLIVALQPEDPDLIKKLEKSGNANLTDIYRSKIAELNESIKTAFTNWPYQQSIEFKLPGDIMTLFKKNANDYAIVVIWEVVSKANATYYSPYLDWSYKNILKGDYGEDDKTGKDSKNKSTFMTLLLGEKYFLQMKDNAPQTPIYEVGLSDIYPTKADLITGVYNMKYYLDYRESGRSASEEMQKDFKLKPKLSSVTLLIRQSDLAKGFTKENIGNLYHYKFEVVPDSVLDNNVANKTPDMAYLINVPSRGAAAQEIIDCETGELLGEVIPHVSPNFDKTYTSGLAGGNGTVDEKTFKDLASRMGGN